MNTTLNKNTVGLSSEQLVNGTPSDKRIVLKGFYKDEKCTISPAKDMNGRYLGIQEDIPDIKKLEMGYVPSVESRVRVYDGMTIDLNDPTWAKDWEWMKHCAEIANDFEEGQGTKGAYFYIFRPGFDSAKKIKDQERVVKLYNYIFKDSIENLYNRASILGVDMSEAVVSDVKEYLMDMVKTNPDRVEQLYESKTFSLELLLIEAIKRGVVNKKNGVYTFGEILLGVEESAVIAYFANPKNQVTTRAIEAVTYNNTKSIKKNPLEDEVRQGDDFDVDLSKDTSEEYEEEDELTPQQKAAKTRADNLAKARAAKAEKESKKK